MDPIDSSLDPSDVIGADLTLCARQAEDAMRRLARLTIRPPNLTPADVDTVLSHLTETIAALPQATARLGSILDRCRDTHELAMDGMTATTAPDLAIDTARLHLDALRDSAVETYRHLNAARNEVAHICASPRTSGTNETTERPAGRRSDLRQPPGSAGPDRRGPAR